MENLRDGLYVLDIRSRPIDGIKLPEGGAVITLPDGRQAIITPDTRSAQIDMTNTAMWGS